MRKINLIVFACLILAASGCSTTKVTRVDVSEKIDLSGEWNDYDALTVAKEMVKDSLDKPWLSDFAKMKGKEPTVIVGHVANRSHEHINTQVITKYLEEQLLNSGKVIFVASPQEREDIREERQDQQQGFTEPETIKKIGHERGADFMLIGSINSIKDQIKGKAVVYYQVNLELVDLLTNQKVWIGQKEIKKRVDHPQFSL